MVGSAVTGALSLGFGATSRAPHGGIWVIGLIGRPGLYVLAILAGVAVSAACVVVAKSIGREAVAGVGTSEDAVHAPRGAVLGAG
jgi:PTS system fructose-specific IIC component